jgi:acetyl-CoA decarbonylase/synthase complex subunit gamma
MAKLTGLEIYKLLPKTNCGDCNFPTCMAFAMQVAAKKVGLEQCPHVSEEAKATLAEAAAPPMRTVTIGSGEGAVKIGGETVLFRHEDKFHHPTAIAIRVKDSEDVSQKVEQINSLKFIRVGKEVQVDLVALEQTQDGSKFVEAVKSVQSKTQLPLVLISQDPEALEGALEAIPDRRPLIYAATSENHQRLGELAKRFGAPLAVRAESLEELAELASELKQLGVEDLVLDPVIKDELDGLVKLTKLRRLALEKTFRPLGYPVMALIESQDPYQETIQAIVHVCKYGSLVIMGGAERWQILPVLTARFNIFTDPQVPNAVEAKLYQVGEPTPESPVLVTTNFALTYFTVEGEVANSKVPAYIAVVDTGGLGVLNAYADEKLTGEVIAKAVKAYGVKEKVKHNKLIIPGLVAVLKGEVEDEAGCEVIVGPEEAAGIPGFLRNEWQPSVN